MKIGLSICKHFEKRVEEIDSKSKKFATTKVNVKTDQTVKLLKQTAEHLEPPKMLEIERKLQIGKHEDYYESSFANQDIAALYFHFLPIQGPLVIVPCQSERSKNNNFTLKIYSDKKVSISKLDESKNVCLVSSWESATSGGSELYNDKFYKEPDMQSWQSNPKFSLNFDSTHPAKVTISLSIATKNWRGKIAMNKLAKEKLEAEKRKKGGDDRESMEKKEEVGRVYQ